MIRSKLDSEGSDGKATPAEYRAESDPALRPFLSLLEKDIQQKPAQLEPMDSDFLAVAIFPRKGFAIAIAGSWENLVNFDPGSFEFTNDDAAELSDLFAEIEAEESA